MAEQFLETGGSDSLNDPSYTTFEETYAKLSNLSINKTKSKTSIVEVVDVEEDPDGEEVLVPELNQIDARSYEHVHKIIQDKQIEKLKVEQCKLYLRKNGLRLTGTKDTLIQRIKEHLEILIGGGENKYPASSFAVNCKGDACTGDVVMFEQNVYEMFDIASRSGRGPPCGTRIVAGRIVKESYGAAKQQHTFTIEVLWSKGEKPLPPLHPLLIKGRNLYRLKTLRQRWEDEGERQKALMEKHSRGSLARFDREARVQEKEMSRAQRTNRVSRKEERLRNQSRSNSTSTFNTSVQPHQSYPPANPPNIHQSIGPGNTKMGPQLGLSTDSSKPATLTHHFMKPATQPRVPQSSLMTVDHGKVTSEPQVNQQSLMQGWYLSQVSQRQPLTSVNHSLLTSRQAQKQVCRHYAEGRCYYGGNCKFSHDMSDTVK